MHLLVLQKPGYPHRYALISREGELLLLDFHQETLEEDLDTALAVVAEPGRVLILQTHSDPALQEARERLHLLLPEANSLVPEDDLSALAPRRFGRHGLQILPMGAGFWGYALGNYLFLGSVRDRTGRWRGDAEGSKLVAQHGAERQRLWAFPATAEKVIDLALLRARRAA